ncbi:hypothetical protein BHE74_00005116, partial [Ensete ventricosum]
QAGDGRWSLSCYISVHFASHRLALRSATDYAQEREMEIEALQVIPMDDIDGVMSSFSMNGVLITEPKSDRIDASESELSTQNRYFRILLTPQVKDPNSC